MLLRLLFALVLPLSLSALEPPLQKWKAEWIAPAGVALDQDLLVRFRRDFSLSEVPKVFLVHVSADLRYRLFVNGSPVFRGPQRGDLFNWHYDEIDLSPYLRAGDNVVAAEVVHHHAPAGAYHHLEAGFLLQGVGAAAGVIDTDKDWKALVDTSYQTLPSSAADLRTYFVAGPGDSWNGAEFPWGWETPAGAALSWKPVLLKGRGEPRGLGTDITRALVPRSIPAMEEVPLRWASVRRAQGFTPPQAFPSSVAPLVIPPRTTATLLLDQGFEVNAFPELLVSGGRGARIDLAYAEALVDGQRHKGNRNDVEGRQLIGVFDRFLPDGGANRLFTTVDFRCYRYAELRLQTADEPLEISDLRARRTGYPFVERAVFSSDDPSLKPLWEVGWRTARNCAYETYMDCPYYERLQYVGDTRIQALVSLAVSGDDRLVRQAIEAFDDSRLAEGLTRSRHPSATPQVIPTFSLYWVEMLCDFSELRDDPAFIEKHLDGAEAVLGWFGRRLDPATGLLGPLPYWSFVDWTEDWPWNHDLGAGGEPPGVRTGGSVIVSLQYACTLKRAARLLAAHGRSESAEKYRARASAILRSVRESAWNAGRHCFMDTPGGATTSQHVNALAVLAGAVPPSDQAPLMERVLEGRGMTASSLYFRFYVLRAMREAGMGNRYLEQLGDWHAMVADGLTTFAEKPGETRSDCHAWSASPVYEFLATVAGIEPANEGFRFVRIEPHLGKLRELDASMPHPRGEVRVSYRIGDKRRHASITLPEGTEGVFIWTDFRVPLRAGTNEFDF